LTGVTTDMVITKEETFGPVAPLYRFKTDAEAIKMANDTEFGLAAYFYSRDIGRIWRVAEALEYGIVGINEGINLDRDRPVWRHEGKRHRPRRVEIRHRGIPRCKYLCMGGIDR
jgi:succinate-semialdehyde dehydrogenase/glutarate-semialdehyde dehydrogenase